MPITKDIDDKEEKKKFTHVDEFIDYGSTLMGDESATDEEHEMEAYARWVLDYFRHSAICKNAFYPFMKDNKLFCHYKGQKYRVIGASRLGDVWLTDNFDKETGYDERVCVTDCSQWEKLR